MFCSQFDTNYALIPWTIIIYKSGSYADFCLGWVATAGVADAPKDKSSQFVILGAFTWSILALSLNSRSNFSFIVNSHMLVLLFSFETIGDSLVLYRC